MSLGAQRLEALGQVVQLRRAPAGRAEIAYLLQPQDQLEDVLDSNVLPLFAEPQYPFPLRAFVRLTLLAGQRQGDLGNHLGWELRQDVALLPTQLQGPMSLEERGSREE